MTTPTVTSNPDIRGGLDEGAPGAFAVDGPAAPTPAPFLQPPQEAATDAQVDGFLIEESNHLAPINQDLEGQVLDHIEQVEAIPMPPQNATNNNARKKSLLIAAMSILLVGLTIVLCIMLLDQKQQETGPKNAEGTSTPSSSPTSGPIAESYPPFRDDLKPLLLKTIQQGGPATPESRANSWMWKDPHLQNYTLERQMVRFSLASLYYSTQGDQWHRNDHWLDPSISECLWFSQANQPVCDEDKNMLRLELQNNNLNGTLPQYNFWDVKPTYVDVSHNSIQGAMPTLPPDTSWLEYLYFSHNNFSSPMTAEAGFLENFLNNLLVADLANNCIGGNNKGIIYRFTPQLQIINMTNTCVKGEITPYYSYTQMQHLALANNDLYGTMPTEMGLVTTLQTMNYAGNAWLTGTLPSELNQLTNLVSLDLVGTQFTGLFPEGLCERQRQGLLEIHANCSLMECCL